MGVDLPSVSTTTLLTSVLGQNVETAAIQSPPINLPLDNAQILIFWYLIVTTGGSTTQLGTRLRRGTGLTGTVVNIIDNTQVTAGNNIRLAGCYSDTPGIVAGQVYTLSVQSVGAAAAGAFIDGCMTLMVL